MSWQVPEFFRQWMHDEELKELESMRMLDIRVKKMKEGKGKSVTFQIIKDEK